VAAVTRLTRRERAVIAALADTVVAPVPPLPAVEETDTLASFAAWLGASPPLNRLGLRFGLWAIGRRRFAERDRAHRTASLTRLEHSPLSPLVRALTGVMMLSYYGDDGVSRLLGYDADANVRRGRALIADEGRLA
jgi:hypothetical protein